MHGLVITAIRRFVTSAYGEVIWARVSDKAGLSGDPFQSLVDHDRVTLDRLIGTLIAELGVSRGAVMEDIGTSIVTQSEPVRRLLRFGGATFHDFLLSLEDLPGRARLAIPELVLPRMEVQNDAEGRFIVACDANVPDAGHVLAGILRAIADDYGALVTIDHAYAGPKEELKITVHDAAFAAGARFSLARHDTR